MSREYNFYVYLLTNVARMVLYIGVTSHLENRLHEHRTGKWEGFTKRCHVNRLVYYEHFRYVLDALDREKQLKGWKRVKKDALVMSINPHWRDLSAEWPRYKDEM